MFSKKQNLSLVLIFFTYLLPIYFLYSNKENSISQNVQIILLIMFFAGSILVSCLNWKKEGSKTWNLVFKYLGIAGFLYSGYVLVMLYLFRNCCGF